MLTDRKSTGLDLAASNAELRPSVGGRRLSRRTLLSALTFLPGPRAMITSDRSVAQGMAPLQRVELLMFEEPGCPWCRRWRAEVGPGYASSAEGRRAPLRVIGLHEPLPSGITLAQRVNASPTFVLLEDGREVGRIVGYPGADFFWGLLDVLLRKLKPS